MSAATQGGMETTSISISIDSLISRLLSARRFQIGPLIYLITHYFFALVKKKHYVNVKNTIYSARLIFCINSMPSESMI